MKKKKGLTLVEYLEKHGIRQSHIAEKIGVLPTMIYRFTKGKSTPTLKQALEIERITNGEVSVYSWELSQGTCGVNSNRPDKNKNKKSDP